MKLPLISGQKLLKILSSKGYEKGVLITVPIHGNKPVSIGVLHKILRDSEITREEFIEICNKI